MKYFKQFFLIFLTFIFIISNTFALSINIYGDVSEYSKQYNEEIVVNINCGESLNLSLPNGAKNTYFNKKTISSNSILIDNCNSKNIITYTLNKLEVLDSKNFRVERNFIGYDVINYTYSLYLPSSYILNENKTIPNNYNQIISNNKKLINFDKSNIYVVYFSEKIEGSNFNLNHFKKEFTEPIAIFLIIFFFFLGVFITYLYFNFYKKKDISQVVPSFVLSKEERDILDVIKKTPGINQKHIGEELNFSKARVSAFINDLEQKKLIRRERFGRTFKVFMEKEVI